MDKHHDRHWLIGQGFRPQNVHLQRLLTGIWSVDQFEVDGEMRPMLLSEESRWRRVIFDGSWRSAIQLMNDSHERFHLALELEKKSFVLRKLDDRSWKSQFSFEQPEAGVIKLDGKWDDHSIRAKLRRTEEPKFPLTNWKFHWIDAPNNR